MTEIDVRLILAGNPPFENNGAMKILLLACGISAKWESVAYLNEKMTSRWAYFTNNQDEMWEASQKCGPMGGAVFCPFRDGCIVSGTEGGSALILPMHMALPDDVLKKRPNTAAPSAGALFSGDKRYRAERLRLVFWTAAVLCFCGEKKLSLLAAADKAREQFIIHNS